MKFGGGSSAFGAPQGVLECWVDIMTPEIATAFEPDDVSLPAVQIFEVRVVIWKSKNVPAMDSLENMSDLYVKGSCTSNKPIVTQSLMSVTHLSVVACL